MVVKTIDAYTTTYPIVHFRIESYNSNWCGGSFDFEELHTQFKELVDQGISCSIWIEGFESMEDFESDIMLEEDMLISGGPEYER